jgi:sulfur relay (sulfurtransferase) DsrF/TusC family protein
MGIVQVKIKNEEPTDSSTSLTEGKQEKSIQTRMVNTKYRNICIFIIETKLVSEASLRKKSFT